MLVPAQAGVAEFIATFKDYPPRQKAASFNVDDVFKKMQESSGSK
jgi:arylsulfatase